MHPVCHYFDPHSALRSGYYLRQIIRGKHKGKHWIETSEGKKIRVVKIRNIEQTGGKDNDHTTGGSIGQTQGQT